jgi:glycosyltransferase involved in cell wall biosynthesis
MNSVGLTQLIKKYQHLELLEFQPKVAVILGNGPSSKLLNFELLQENHIATVGMNVAYRYWNEIDFRPTHYICMDTVVIQSHADVIYKLIHEGRIKKFFLRDEIKDIYPDITDLDNILWYSKALKEYEVFQTYYVTTGSWAIRWMAHERMKIIATIGIDANYVELLPEAKKIGTDDNDVLLQIEQTPNFNPNYFFSKYQQVGDKYNIPNDPNYVKDNNGNLVHVDALKKVSESLKCFEMECKIYDLSPISSHGIFEKMLLQQFFDHLKLLVITSFPQESSISPAIEINIEMLLLNISNPFVREIVLLFEGCWSSFELALPLDQQMFFKQAIKNKKLYVIETSERPSYWQLFNLANQFGRGLCVIQNSDIYLPVLSAEKLIIDSFSVTNLFHVLTRWNLTINGTFLQSLTPHPPWSEIEFSNFSLKDKNYFSYDTYCFNTPILVPESTRKVLLGSFGCDTALAAIFKSSGFTVSNPCLLYEFIHVDDKPRNYSDDKSRNDRIVNVDAVVETIRKKWDKNLIGKSLEYLSSLRRYVAWIGHIGAISPWQAIYLILGATPWSGSIFPKSLNFRKICLTAQQLNSENFSFDPGELLKEIEDREIFLEWELSGFETPEHIVELLSKTKSSRTLSNFLSKYPRISMIHVDKAQPEEVSAVFDVIVLIKECLMYYSVHTGTGHNAVVTIEDSRKNELLTPLVKSCSVNSLFNHMLNENINVSQQSSLIEKSCGNTNKMNLTAHGTSKRVTIALSCYKADNYIDGYIDCLKSQENINEIQLVVFDYPYSHADPQQVKETIHQLDKTTLLYMDRGTIKEDLYTAWNQIFSLSNTEYIANLNVDDRVSQDYFNLAVKTLDSLNLDVFSTNAIALSIAGDLSSEIYRHRHFDEDEFNESMVKIYGLKEFAQVHGGYFKKRNPPHCVPVWRLAWHKCIGDFNPSKFDWCSDYEYWLRMAAAGAKFGVHNSFKTYFLSATGTASDRLYLEDNQSVIEAWKISFPLAGYKETSLGKNHDLMHHCFNLHTYFSSREYFYNQKDLVSIVVLYHKIDNYLPECIKSIQSQDYPLFECVLVFDNDPESKLQHYCRSLVGDDLRFRFVSLGQKCERNYARNVGIELAIGDYITIVDGDDMLPRDSLSKRLNYISKLPSESKKIVFGGFRCFHEDGEESICRGRDSYNFETFRLDVITHCGVMFPAKLLKQKRYKTNRLDLLMPSFKIGAEDVDLMISFLKKNPGYEYINCNSITYDYRYLTGTSRAKRCWPVSMMLNVLIKYYGLPKQTDQDYRVSFAQRLLEFRLWAEYLKHKGGEEIPNLPFSEDQEKSLLRCLNHSQKESVFKNFTNVLKKRSKDNNDIYLYIVDTLHKVLIENGQEEKALIDATAKVLKLNEKQSKPMAGLVSQSFNMQNISCTTSIRFYELSCSSYFTALSEKTWRYTHPGEDVPQNQWLVAFDVFDSTLDRSYVSGIRLMSNKKMTVRVTLGRHGDIKWEGSVKLICLQQNVPQSVKINHKFVRQHEQVKVQIQVLEIEDGNIADLTFDDIYVHESLDSLRQRLSENEINLSVANRRFREDDYETAMGIYLLLHQKHPLPFELYSRNAIMAARKLGIDCVTKIDELIERVS